MWLGQIIKVAFFVWGAKQKKIFGVVPNQFGFGAAAKGKRDVRFDSTTTIAHHASSLK
jgi:hypothetical protein